MTTTNETSGKPGGRLPPRFVIRAAWLAHRALYRLSGGRLGLRPATEKTWGMMRLKTVGRKSGRERLAILGYYEDGPNLVTMAMNGWGEPEPAWWLNLQAHPDTTVELHDRTLAVRGPRRHAGGAAAAVGAVEPIRRRRARRLGLAPAGRNRGRHPRASLSGRAVSGWRRGSLRRLATFEGTRVDPKFGNPVRGKIGRLGHPDPASGFVITRVFGDTSMPQHGVHDGLDLARGRHRGDPGIGRRRNQVLIRRHL